MTKKQFVSLEKKLLPELPGFVIHGSLMLLPPAKHTLRGIALDGSDFSKTSFYVEVFVTPLYIPRDFLGLSHGGRVRDPRKWDCWESDDPDLVPQLVAAIKQQALPKLLRVKSLLDFVAEVRAATAELARPPNGSMREEMAYALVLAGQVADGAEVLDEALRAREQERDPDMRPWVVELFNRMRLIRSMLATDAEAARQQIEAWETVTVGHLGLEAYR
jgi:hypothetical protein